MRTSEDLCAIYIDMGTTNTRVWLMRGDQVVAQAAKLVGVRDSARAGSNEPIREALRTLTAEVTTQQPAVIPTCVIAAGMISSSLGLADIPFVAAPAGVDDLAVAAQWFEFPGVIDLPTLLVPGIRSGPTSGAIDSFDSLDQRDVMRGEETLCVGLMAQGLVEPPALVLNLGSHWKTILLDEDGRIASSTTSLSGELIHTAQTHTLLAGSVPGDRPATLTNDWVKAGMKEQRRSGLGRALFCVRLLALRGEGTPEDRLAFLIGAFIASDLDALRARGVLTNDRRVAIVGNPAVAEAWRNELISVSVPATVITPTEAERAITAGLRSILSQSHQLRRGNKVKPCSRMENAH